MIISGEGTRDLMKLTSLAGSQDRSADGVDAVNEAVMIVAHRVTRQETGVAQRREPFLPVTRLDYVSTHEVPVIQGIAEGILVVTQDLLCFLSSTQRYGNRMKSDTT